MFMIRPSYRTKNHKPCADLNNASVHVAFRKTDDVGTRDFQAFAAQWLAYAFPYRRFDAALADCAARLGADAGCYSFIVADFHHLLPAGFAGAPVCLKFAQPKGILRRWYFDESGLCEIDENFCLSRRETSLAICLQDKIEALMNTRIRSRRPKRQRMLTTTAKAGDSFIFIASPEMMKSPKCFIVEAEFT